MENVILTAIYNNSDISIDGLTCEVKPKECKYLNEVNYEKTIS